MNDTEEYKKKAKSDFENGNYSNIITNATFEVYKAVNNVTHKVSDFFIANVPILKDTVRVNYDGVGNVLIGMDIMKDWDIHIGTISSGETFFLACPKDSLNDDYYIELNRLFGICNTIAATSCN